MQTHLVVVSIPWRRSSLERLLSTLETASYRPDSVTLLLQQYPSLPRLPAGFENRVRALNLRRNTGPAVRWLWADRMLPPDDICCVLDDDFVPGPDYFLRTAEPIKNGNADAVGWYGATPWWQYVAPQQHVPSALPLRVVAGGACAFRVRALRGLREYPLANMLCTVDGGDDIWSSAVMRRNGARMIRPEGSVDIESTEHQNDLRSIKWSRGLDSSGKMFLASEVFG